MDNLGNTQEKIWGITIWETHKKRPRTNEIKFFQSTTNNTNMDKKRNAYIYQELTAVPLLDYPENYRHNWTIHLHRMNRCRIPIWKITGLMEKDHSITLLLWESNC